MPNPAVERVDILPSVRDDRQAAVVPRRLMLHGFVHESIGPDGVAVNSLAPGTALVVETCNSHYRFVVLDGPHVLVLVKGGAMFPEATPVRLEGATAGGSALKMGWIVVGLKIEMSRGLRRVRSSPVLSVAIEGVPSLCHSHSSVA